MQFCTKNIPIYRSNYLQHILEAQINEQLSKEKDVLRAAVLYPLFVYFLGYFANHIEYVGNGSTHLNEGWPVAETIL
jgi:hypothetical protein